MSAVSITVYDRPTEPLPWRVTARKGDFVATYKRNTEQEARDLERAIIENN
jgi:hypothetical protein